MQNMVRFRALGVELWPKWLSLYNNLSLSYIFSLPNDLNLSNSLSLSTRLSLSTCLSLSNGLSLSTSLVFLNYRWGGEGIIAKLV